MSSRRSIRAPVVLGLLVVVTVGLGSYAWLAASAPGRVMSATAPSPPPSAPTGDDEVPGSDTGSASGYDQQRVDALASLVPARLASSCAAAAPAGTGDPSASSAVATLLCLQGGNTIVYEAHANGAALDRAFASAVSGSGVDPNAGGCWDGSPGVVGYSYGQVACWDDPASGIGTVTWTYEPGNVIGSVTGTSDLHALVDWWWFRALLQPAAEAGGLRPEEEALVELLPADLQAACKHYDPLKDASGYNPVGSLGSIDCFPGGAKVADVGFFAFTTADALAAWYDYRVAQADVEAGSGGCLDGTTGETAWEHGRILCTLAGSGKAAIRWTDDRYQVYGALNGTSKDLRSLVRWWTAQQLP